MRALGLGCKEGSLAIVLSIFFFFLFEGERGEDECVCLPLHIHKKPCVTSKWPSAITRLTDHPTLHFLVELMICTLGMSDAFRDA